MMNTFVPLPAVMLCLFFSLPILAQATTFPKHCLSKSATIQATAFVQPLFSQTQNVTIGIPPTGALHTAIASLGTNHILLGWTLEEKGASKKQILGVLQDLKLNSEGTPVYTYKPILSICGTKKQEVEQKLIALGFFGTDFFW